MKQFGKKRAGLTYKDRPGAYAVIADRGKIAVMKNPQGYYLPGGGTDGEAPETALAREILEEAGMGVAILREIGMAAQFCLSDCRTYGFNKLGTFYAAAFTEKLAEPVEHDHELLWLPPTAARAKLTLGFQKWALDEALNA